MEPATRRMPGSGWLAAIGVVVVGALVAIVLLGDPRIVEYDEGTPEAAAQDYVQALFDDDSLAAHALLSDEWQSRCDPYRMTMEHHFGDGAVATFENVEVEGERAIVWLRLDPTEFEVDPFSADEEIETRIVLEQRASDWRVADADWPFFPCFER